VRNVRCNVYSDQSITRAHPVACAVVITVSVWLRLKPTRSICFHRVQSERSVCKTYAIKSQLCAVVMSTLPCLCLHHVLYIVTGKCLTQRWEMTGKFPHGKMSVRENNSTVCTENVFFSLKFSLIYHRMHFVSMWSLLSNKRVRRVFEMLHVLYSLQR